MTGCFVDSAFIGPATKYVMSQESNNKIFAQQVRDYDVAYRRGDEQEVINRYFSTTNASMLVVGCGAGRTLPMLSERGYAITAIDIVPEMVEAAKKRVKDLHIDVKVMDVSRMTFDDKSFDYVFFPFHGIDCVHPDIYKAVKEMTRILKDDGVLVFSSHNRFYLKKLHHFFDGNYSNYRGLLLYRTTPLDFVRLKRYFGHVRMIQRITLQNKTTFGWKDWCYRLIPLLSKSTYFICEKPKYD